MTACIDIIYINNFLKDEPVYDRPENYKSAVKLI